MDDLKDGDIERYQTYLKVTDITKLNKYRCVISRDTYTLFKDDIVYLKVGCPGYYLIELMKKLSKEDSFDYKIDTKNDVSSYCYKINDVICRLENGNSFEIITYVNYDDIEGSKKEHADNVKKVGHLLSELDILENKECHIFTVSMC